MKVFWRRVKTIVLGVLCVVLALICSPIPWSISYAISTHDVAPFWWIVFHPLLVFTLTILHLGMVVAAPITFLASWKIAKLRPFRPYALLVWPLSWGLFASFIGSNAGWTERRTGLQQAAKRAQPLLAAIERYRADRGQPPAELSQLVPQYLVAIPSTGMAAHREFRYRSDADRAEGADFHSYELSVSTPFGMNFDSFNYWPEGDYPPQMYGGHVERIGAWAYVHE